MVCGRGANRGIGRALVRAVAALVMLLGAGDWAAFGQNGPPMRASPPIADPGVVSPPPTASAEAPKGGGVDRLRMLSPPPLQWDHAMVTGLPALHQGRSDFLALTDGFAFGMNVRDVNAALPRPIPSLAWASLPQATEFVGDVRYFWIYLADAGSLRVGSSACVGSGSYLVLFFTPKGLVRLSYRLTPDVTCRSVAAAATEIYARYVTIGREVAYSVHYRTGSADVIDVTDPNAGFMIPVHWQQLAR
jgi:hypothetical protein